MCNKLALPWIMTACISAVMLWQPAQAGLLDDDEARARIETLRKDVTESLQKVDTSVATSTRNQIELSNQIEQAKADLARLRGQIEVLVHELETAQKRQKDFYVDLDGRLRKLETTATEEDTSPPESAAQPVDPAAEMRHFEAALTQFKAMRYKDALTEFEAFIQTNPRSALLPSAYFWSASSHLQMKSYAKAADLFGKLATTWPADAKAPDALLGQANSQQAGGDLKGGRKTFEQLIGRYPDSRAAQLARQSLKKK